MGSLLLAAVVAGMGAKTEAADRSRVLFLGDSLSIGAFGQTFDSALRSSGFQVHTVVAGGATPYYWLKSYQTLPCTIGFWEKSEVSERRVGYVRAVPKLEDLMADAKPNVVVVQTGINLYATLRSKRRPKEDNVAEVRSLIDQMCYAIADAGAISYWVLPPHSHEERYTKELQDELASIMREVVTKYEGTVFESQKVTKFVDPYPATDGIHYGPAEARGWAEKVSSHFNAFMKVAPPATTKAIVRAVPLQSPPKERFSDSGTGEHQDLPDEVALRIKLETKSGIGNASELAYANALGLYEYQVVKDLRGNYPFDKIRIAQGIIFNRKLTGAAKAEVGSETELVLVPFTKYKNLSSWQMFDDLRPNFEIPIYTPKLD
ncbi:MAG: SGNH/GDSL hydrolase family protein [Verrucomicrobiales bacterium]|nr:SGNH/GDSL hydrolase family protein [Verrucomicrobiales bacterium]